MTTLAWIISIPVAIVALAYLGLWAAFFVVGMLPDAGDYD